MPLPRLPSDTSFLKYPDCTQLGYNCKIPRVSKVADIPVDDAGGSMGPIYGTFFTTLSEGLSPSGAIDAERLGKLLSSDCRGAPVARPRGIC
ncbi:DAK2 domain-containing protein [Tractidigestivibacter sp.]|uniref:DAK2 domain-containing protein n=1 Tax=Tractidigestivibacter sp. TaxID=2847320 RepID=UPI0039C01525